MRKKVSFLLALVFCLGMVPCASADNSPFNDVASDYWAYSEILEAYNDGVMTGTAPGVFSPSGKLNMAQFVTVLTRAFYNDDVLNSIRADTWPNRNYDAAEKHNLFTDLKQWHSEVEVTREVMAQMMYNVMTDKGVVLLNAQELADTISRIPDSSSIDAAFQTAVATCYYWDLLSGTDASGSFAPKGLINRAQTAVIYTRLKKAVNVLGVDVPEAPKVTTPDTTENPGDAATLTNGMPVTEENVLALIEEYRNGKEPGEKAKAAGFTSYAPRSKYDAYNPTYYLNPFGNGTECAKYAFALWDDIFGAEVVMREVTDLTMIRPGDLLQFPGHWAVATGRSSYDDFFGRYFVDDTGGGSSGSIGWPTNPSLIVDGMKVYTRYPE